MIHFRGSSKYLWKFMDDGQGYPHLLKPPYASYPRHSPTNRFSKVHKRQCHAAARVQASVELWGSHGDRLVSQKMGLMDEVADVDDDDDDDDDDDGDGEFDD